MIDWFEERDRSRESEEELEFEDGWAGDSGVFNNLNKIENIS
jgi:hypothetical protein